MTRNVRGTVQLGEKQMVGATVNRYRRECKKRQEREKERTRRNASSIIISWSATVISVTRRGMQLLRATIQLQKP